MWSSIYYKKMEIVLHSPRALRVLRYHTIETGFVPEEVQDTCNSLLSQHLKFKEIIMRVLLRIIQIFTFSSPREMESIKTLHSIVHQSPFYDEQKNEYYYRIQALLLQHEFTSNNTTDIDKAMLMAHKMRLNDLAIIEHIQFISWSLKINGSIDLNHIYVEMRRWLLEFQKLDKSIKETWSYFVVQHLPTVRTLILKNYSEWLSIEESMINRSMDNLKFSDRIQIGRCFYDTFFQSNEKLIFEFHLNYAKNSMLKFQPIDLFDVFCIRFVIEKDNHLSESEMCNEFNCLLIQYFYLSCELSEDANVFGALIEVVTLFFTKNKHLLIKHKLLIENYVFIGMKSYPNTELTYELIKNILPAINLLRQIGHSLDNLVYDCIIQQCSHKWIHVKQVNNNESDISFHSYVMFWVHLFTIESQENVISIDDRRQELILFDLFDCFMESIFKSFAVFNFDVKKNNTTLNKPLEEYARNQDAVNRTDITIFENIALLCKKVFKKIKIHFPISWAFRLFIKSTAWSMQYPLICGFYKLVAISSLFMENNRNVTQLQHSDQQLSYHLVFFNYVHSILPMLRHDITVLQQHVFKVILSTPTCLVPYFLKTYAPIFIKVLKSQNYALIKCCLQNIVNWSAALDGKEINWFLLEMVPCFKLILISYSSMEFKQEIIDFDKNYFTNILKCVNVTKDLIIKLLSSLNLVIPKYIFTGSSKKCLYPIHFFLPIADLQPSIRLALILAIGRSKALLNRLEAMLKQLLTYCDVIDQLLPQIEGHMVLSGANKNISIAACELLYTIAVYSLAICAQSDVLPANDLKAMINEIIKNILLYDTMEIEYFNSLLVGISRIISSRPHFHSNFASSFINTLFDGVAVEMNLHSCKMSLYCLNEFIHRPLQCENNEIYNKNTEAFINTICQYLLHQSSSARIGAAKAFNCTAKTFLSQDYFVNKYSIYILHSMVSSLDSFPGENDELSSSLDTMYSVFFEFKDILIKESEERMNLKDLDNATFKSMFLWIAEKCSSQNFQCRNQCMIFINKFSHIFPDANVTGVLVMNLNKLIDRLDDPKLMEWITLLHSCIDCYKFILSLNPMSVRDVKIFPHFVNLKKMLRADVEISTDKLDSTIQIEKVKYAAKMQKTCTLLIDTFISIFSDKTYLSQDKEDLLLMHLKFLILNYFTNPSKLVYVELIDKPNSDPIILSMSNLRKNELIWDKIVNCLDYEFCQRVDDIMNCMLQSSCLTDENVLCAQNLEMLHSNYNIVNDFQNWKWKLSQTVNHIDKILQLPKQMSHETKLFLNFIIKIGLKMETDAKIIWDYIFDFATLPDDFCIFRKYKFFCVFKVSITNYLVSNIDNNMVIGSLCCPMKLSIVSEILKYNESISDFRLLISQHLASQWPDLSTWVSNNSQHKHEIFELIFSLVGYDSGNGINLPSEIRKWLLDNLSIHTDPPCIKLLPYVTVDAMQYLLNQKNDSNFDLKRFGYNIMNQLIATKNIHLLPFALLAMTESRYLTKIFGLLSNLICRLSSKIVKELIVIVYKTSMNTQNSDYSHRINIVEYVLIPLCQQVNEEILIHFLGSHIMEMKNIIEQPLLEEVALPLDQLNLICSKTINLISLEMLFGAIDSHSFVINLNKQVENGDAYKQQLLTIVFNIRKLNPKMETPEYSECWRNFQCAAWKCLAAMVCSTKNSAEDREFYYLLFRENKSYSIWNNITYRQQFKLLSYIEYKLSKKKIMKSTFIQNFDLKNLYNEKFQNKSSSFDFSHSSVSQECKTIDFVGKVVVPKHTKENLSSFCIELKHDSVNQNSCMASICAVIKKTVSIGVTNNSCKTMPKWMTSLCNSLKSSMLNEDAKLFIIKLIYNCKDVFQPYAKEWIFPMLYCLSKISLFQKCGIFCYFFHKVINLLTSWSDVNLPCGEEKVLNELVRQILSATILAQEEDDMKIHLSSMRKILAVWSGSINNPPSDIIKDLLLSHNYNQVKIVSNVVQIFLEKNMIVFDNLSHEEYFSIIVKVIKEYYPKDIKDSVSHWLGLSLSKLHDLNPTVCSATITNTQEYLEKVFIKDKGSFCSLLHNLQRNCNYLSVRFIPHITSLLTNTKMKKLHVLCLQVLNNVIKHHRDHDYWNEFDDHAFLTFINSEDEDIQYHSTETIFICLENSVALPSGILTCLKLLSLSDNITIKMKILLCDILMLIYTKDKVSLVHTKEDKELATLAKNYLFGKLFDESEFIQQKVYRFWLETAEMPKDAREALFFLLDLSLDIKTDNNILGVTINLFFDHIFKNWDQLVFPHASAECNLEPSYASMETSNTLKIYPPLFVEQHNILPNSHQAEYHSVSGHPKLQNCMNKTFPAFKYFVGDYPFANILFRDVLMPIQKLSLMDSKFAETIFISFFNSLFSTTSSHDFTGQLKVFLNKTLLANAQNNGISPSAALEIAVANNVVLDMKIVSTVCFHKSVEELGILLFERKFLDGSLKSVDLLEPPLKKLKTSQSNFTNDMVNKSDLQLVVRLYQNLDECNIANGIFREYFKDEPDCETAVYLHLNEYHSLGNWESLDSEITKINYSNNPSNSLATQNKENSILNNVDIFPFLVDWNVHKSITEGKCRSEFSSENWKPLLQESYIEELAVLELLKGKYEKFKFFAVQALNFHLNKLKTICLTSKPSLQNNYLLKLFSIMDTYSISSTKGLTSLSSIQEVKSKLIFPRKLLVNWDVRASYCEVFFQWIKCTGLDVSTFNKPFIEMYSHMVDLALHLGNFQASRKYVMRIKDKVAEEPILSYIYDFKLSQVLLLRAQLESNPGFKMEKLFQSWASLKNPLEDGKIRPKINIHFSQLCIELIGILKNNPCAANKIEIKKLLESSEKIHHSLQSSTCINYELFTCCIKSLENASLCATGVEKRTIYCKIVKFCENGIADFSDLKNDIEQLLIRYVLRAISFDCIEVNQKFPVILQLPSLFTNHSSIFEYESQNVPNRVFLQWLPQFFNCLDESSEKTLIPFLLKLFKLFPKFVYTSFLFWKDTCLHSSKISEHALKKLTSDIQSDTTMKLIEGLNQICHPTMLLKIYLKLILQNLHEHKPFNDILNETKNKCFYSRTTNKLVGKIYEINDKHKDFVENLNEKSEKELQNKISELDDLESIKETRLDQFCPWLADFTSITGEEEIPCDFSISSSRTPVKLMGFLPNIQIINSLRRPIRIVMLGSDGKQYHWLAKIGEDLRQDQRIQQMFHAINTSLERNQSTYSLHLNIYQVVPLRDNFGLIEWIRNTYTLSEFIDRSLTPDEIKIRKKIVQAHLDWIRSPTQNQYDCNIGEIFSKAAQYYSKQDVLNEFQNKIKLLPSNIFQKSIIKTCISSAEYFNVRIQFLKSHSVLSICHWLFGIEDRHLRNFLVAMPHCELIGIDYGFAFNKSLQTISIPELLPFRFTPQFCQLYSPFYKTGILVQTMTDVVKSIDKNSLISLLALFIKELAFCNRNITQHMVSFKDFNCDHCMRIFSFFKRKLDNDNPLTVILDLLKSNNSTALVEVYSRVLDVCMGNPSSNAIELLTELASNHYLLGLSHQVLETWI